MSGYERRWIIREEFWLGDTWSHPKAISSQPTSIHDTHAIMKHEFSTLSLKCTLNAIQSKQAKPVSNRKTEILHTIFSYNIYPHGTRMFPSIVLPECLVDSEPFALLASEIFIGGGEFNEILSITINVTWDSKLCCSQVSGSLEEICLKRYSFKSFPLPGYVLILNRDLLEIMF